MDVIRIHGLEIDCIVGVRPQERLQEQRVQLDLGLGLDVSRAGRAGRITLTCDYDEIAEETIALLRFRRYHLIEMATEELAAMLLGIHPTVCRIEIKLDKPGALRGRARAASVEVHRSRDDFPVDVRATPFGSVESLLETREAGLYRLVVGPGEELPGGWLRATRELEWVLSGDLVRDGRQLERHFPTIREEGEPTLAAVNRSESPAVLFRCTCPPATS